jgi:single-strand DNA-binding protein
MADIEFRVGTISKEDPQVKYLDSGKAVCNFSIRVPGTKANEKYGRVATDPYFLEVAAWEQLGENVAESFRKGDRVIVQGLAGQREWTDKEGKVHTVLTFTAWDAALSCLYQTVEAVDVVRADPETKAQEAAGYKPF